MRFYFQIDAIQDWWKAQTKQIQHNTEQTIWIHCSKKKKKKKWSSRLPPLSYEHFSAKDCLSGSMNRRTLGTIESTYSQWINILTAQIYPAETQPRASLNNMHPNLAWTLWGGDQDALTNHSWHTHAYTQASTNSESTSANTNTHADSQFTANMYWAILHRHCCTPRPQRCVYVTETLKEFGWKQC